MEIQRIKISDQERKLISDFIDEDIGNEIDFNRLMPVVEKIERLQYNINILRNDCSIYDNSFKNTGSGWRKSVKENTKMQSTWLAIIEFIKWYNKEQNVKVSDATEAE